MTKCSPRRLIVATLLAVGVAPQVHSAHMVEIDGANVKFFYDAHFWGWGTATVSNDSISFALSDDYALTAKTRVAGGQAYASINTPGTAALIVVANSGYTLNTLAASTLKGNYELPAMGGSAFTSVTSRLLGGSDYSGGAFIPQALLGTLDTSPTAMSNGSSAGSGSWSSSDSVLLGAYKALQVDPALMLNLSQLGEGSTHAALTSLNYGFVASTVPEPQTYAMLIAGLGLMGWVARCRSE